MPLTGTQQAMAELIAKRLREGMIHPGDPDNDVGPTPIMLPFSHAPGRPKEMNDLLDATVKLLSEAIVFTIVAEGECDITPRDEVAELRMAAGEITPGTNVIPVHCHCDTSRTDPLALLTMTNPNFIVVNGPAILRGLRGRSEKCPHERVDDAG